MRRDPFPYLLLPVAALIAVLPLILQGPSCGHDFDFHVLNWLEAAAQFSHGHLHPHWAFSPAFNAGEPRFVFYPPLSWTLGAILGLILPWTWTPIVYTWLALTASGLAMHRLARAHATPTAALLASTLYLANPYMLFTAYERTAYAELLAAALLPLLVHAILKPRPTILAVAIPLALLWLTNAPAAVMGTYTLAFLAAIRLLQSRRTGTKAGAPGQKASPLSWDFSFDRVSDQPHPRTPSFRRSGAPPAAASSPKVGSTKATPVSIALTTLAGTLLGLSLAAFYILPAAIGRPLVQIAMVVIPGMRIDDNTLFHHTGLTEDALAHDAVLHTASLLAILLLTLTLAALLFAILHAPAPEIAQGFSLGSPPPAQKQMALAPGVGSLASIAKPSSANLIFPLTLLTLTIALLLTPLSLPIWHHAPELAFLQFPWRLLAVLATILGLAAALALSPIGWRTIPRSLAALTLAAVLTAAATPIFRQPCDPEDTVPARLAAFQSHSGSEPTDEYTPAPADNDSLRHNDPPFWLSSNPDAPPPANSTPGTAPLDFNIESPTPQYLILNLRRYPAWQITLNGSELSPQVLAENPRADGLFDLPVPSGASHLRLAYRIGPLEHAADAISLLSALTLLGIAFGGRKSNPLPSGAS